MVRMPPKTKQMKVQILPVFADLCPRNSSAMRFVMSKSGRSFLYSAQLLNTALRLSLK